MNETNTIETLRQIVKNHSAQVLFFNPPAKPVAEGIAGACLEVDDEYGEEYKEYERPRLLVDMQTANMLVLVYDAMKPETQGKIDRLMLSKSGFIKVAEIGWRAVK
jgi:hypothetical protein